ncbi:MULTISPECIES: MFS transporter [Bacillus]|uniref:MFS transporter n=1 Tax=Bacillus TaxID=1386 RepID=UPI000BB7C464|nr:MULTISPECIES: MFS transporter [Bacillus]
MKMENLTILAISSTSFVLVLGNSLLIPILPEMRTDLLLTETEVSLIITIFSIVGAITIPFLGYLSDNISRKKIILVSLFLYGVGGLIAGVASLNVSSFTLEWLLVGRVLQGIGSAGTAPIALALTVDVFKKSEQVKVLGLIEATNSFGKVISPLLGALLAIFMWPLVFFSFPLFCAIIFVLIAFFVEEKKVVPKARQSFGNYVSGLKGVMNQQGKWILVSYVAGGTCLFLIFGMLFYITEFLEARYNTHGVINGLLLSFPLLFLTLGSYFIGMRMEKIKINRVDIVIFNFIICSLLFLVLPFITSLGLFFAIVSIISGSIGCILPCINAIIATNSDSSSRGFVTSIYGSVRFIGIALGPLVFAQFMIERNFILFFSLAVWTVIVALSSYYFIKKSSYENEEQLQPE